MYSVIKTKDKKTYKIVSHILILSYNMQFVSYKIIGSFNVKTKLNISKNKCHAKLKI